MCVCVRDDEERYIYIYIYMLYQAYSRYGEAMEEAFVHHRLHVIGQDTHLVISQSSGLSYE